MMACPPGALPHEEAWTPRCFSGSYHFQRAVSFALPQEFVVETEKAHMAAL